jgi:hypothetical protein
MNSFIVHLKDIAIQRLKKRLSERMLLIRKQDQRIKTLESAMQEFVDTFGNVGDYHEQISVSLSYYRKFNQLLEEKCQNTDCK